VTGRRVVIMPHEYAPEEARALFDKVREQYHAALRGADIRLIFAPGKLTWAGREVTTKVALASPREFDLQEIDAWVLLSRAWWNEVRPSQATSDAERAVLTALVKRAFDHSLCELAWDEDRVRLVTEYAHGEFPAVVDRWAHRPAVNWRNSVKPSCAATSANSHSAVWRRGAARWMMTAPP